MCLGVFGVWKYEMVGVGACCVVMVWAADGEGVSSKKCQCGSIWKFEGMWGSFDMGGGLGEGK